MYQFEIQDDIESRVSSQTVRHLHRLWLRFHAACGDLPAFDDLSPARLEWCAANLMVLEPVGDDDFLYRAYGSAIANAARFDMTGKRVSEFRSDVGRFFREKYRQCLASGRPLYTVHRATHVSTVHTWERLMLPVRDHDGPVLVTLNQPMAFRHEFLQGVLESTSNGVIFAAALPGPGRGGESVEGFQVLSANGAAAQLLSRPPGSLEEKPLEDILPGLLKERITRLCVQVFQSGTQATIQINGIYNGVARVIQASGVRAGDGVTLVLAEVTRLHAQESALRDLEQELVREREARLRLESQLRAVADAGFMSPPPRRADLVAALGAEVDRAARNGTPLSLLVLELDGPGGPEAVKKPVEAGDEVLNAVLRLSQGMLCRRDWLSRVAPSRFAAILPETTDETAHEIASRIAGAIALRFRTEPMLSARITASVGLAVCDPGEAAMELLERAEAALDEARAAGRGHVLRAVP